MCRKRRLTIRSGEDPQRRGERTLLDRLAAQGTHQRRLFDHRANVRDVATTTANAAETDGLFMFVTAMRTSNHRVESGSNSLRVAAPLTTIDVSCYRPRLLEYRAWQLVRRDGQDDEGQELH